MCASALREEKTEKQKGITHSDIPPHYLTTQLTAYSCTAPVGYGDVPVHWHLSGKKGYAQEHMSEAVWSGIS